MKVVEIMKLGKNILEILQKSCIKIDDLRYIEMYDEYCKILHSGGKKSYAVAVIVDTYHVSERQVYYVIRKFEADCNIDADV